MREIEYRSGDDEIVRGALFETQDTGLHPAVVFTHGLLSRRAEWGDYPERLAARGYITLAIDLRGHGASAGPRGYASLPRGVEDIRGALDFLATQPKVDPARLALVGHSLGAALSICLAAEEARVKTLVAIAPPASIRHELLPGEATLYALAGVLGDACKSLTGKSLYFPYRVRMDDLFHHASARQAARANDFLQHRAPYDTAGALLKGMDTLACATDVRVPTLVMRGEHDRVVSTSRLVYDRLAGPKKFVQVSDSGHSIMLDGHGNQAFEEVANWLARNL